MKGEELIEKLLGYATEKLYLAQSDVEYKRLVLRRLLGVKSQGETVSVSVCDYSAVSSDLRQYLTEHGYETVDEYVRFIFGLLEPLPSTVDKTFKLTKENLSLSKACDYFKSLLSYGGYLSDVKIEALSQKCDVVGLYSRSGEVENGAVGYDSPDNRCISFGADDEYLFTLDNSCDFKDQGALVRADGKSFLLDEKAIDATFSFIDYYTDFFVMTEFDSVKELTCKKFVVARDILPVGEATSVATLRSEIYPDVEVCILNTATPVIRFSSYNRNTMTKLICEVLTKWRNYESDELLYSLTPKYSPFSLRLLPDGRYSCDLLLCGGENRFTAFDETPLGGLFANVDESSMRFGKFILSKSSIEALTEAVKFVMGKEQFDYNAASKDQKLSPFADVIAKTMRSSGIVKDEQKALSALYENLRQSVISQLKISDVFNSDGVGVLRLKTFLAHCDVKQA